MDARPTQSDIEAVLYKALADSRGATPDDTQAHVSEGDQIDSLEGVELIVAAEELFGISIDDDELSPACNSITRLADLVSSKIKQQRKEGHP